MPPPIKGNPFKILGGSSYTFGGRMRNPFTGAHSPNQIYTIRAQGAQPPSGGGESGGAGGGGTPPPGDGDDFGYKKFMANLTTSSEMSPDAQDNSMMYPYGNPLDQRPVGENSIYGGFDTSKIKPMYDMTLDFRHPTLTIGGTE